jgi:hypothetical protein
MKHISLEIITWPKELVPTTGTQGGDRGLAMRKNSLEVATLLGKQAPKDMDQAAVSRASSHGVELEIKYETRFPRGPNGERMPTYTLATGCKVYGNNVARKAALADLIEFQTPASPRQIECWLAELSVLCASRLREEMESALMITAYSSRLANYPADVVHDALLKKTWKWWPTWDELQKYCEAAASPRRHMIAALKKPKPDDASPRQVPTAAEKKRGQKLVDEMFPSKSPVLRNAAESRAGNCMDEVPEEISPDKPEE